jgi:hypothetical protein
MIFLRPRRSVLDFNTTLRQACSLGAPESAICVQRFDDSLNSAIHTTYRNWLRSSSMHEPRDPPLKVVTYLSLCRFVCFRLFRAKQTAGQQETKRVCLNKTTTFAREAVAFFNGLRLKQQHRAAVTPRASKLFTVGFESDR